MLHTLWSCPKHKDTEFRFDSEHIFFFFPGRVVVGSVQRLEALWFANGHWLVLVSFAFNGRLWNTACAVPLLRVHRADGDPPGVDWSESQPLAAGRWPLARQSQGDIDIDM